MHFRQSYLFLIRTVTVLFCLLLIAIFLYGPSLAKKEGVPPCLNVYTWSNMFDEQDVACFEQHTGIKVHFIYYDNCEELLAKLAITKGRHGDLLLIADCNIADLVKLDLLVPIDKSKLDFWSAIEPSLLCKPHDLANRYIIPYSWDLYGLGVNLAKFDLENLVFSWQLIFEQQWGAYKVGMMEDGLSALNITQQYLYHDLNHLEQAQVDQIKKVLIHQKSQIEAYTNLRSDYLLACGSSPVVTTQAACIYHLMQKNGKIKFVMPQEGGFISTENFAILKPSLKHDLAYLFINFMYQKKVMANYIHKTNFLPARTDLLHEINLDYIGGTQQLFEQLKQAKLAYFTYTLPREQIMQLWMEVKAN